MENPKRTKLPSLILSLYKNNLGLFLRIMLPVAIIAIILNISIYYYSVSRIEQIHPIEQVHPEVQRTNENNSSQTNQSKPDQQENSVSVTLNTNAGIMPLPTVIFRELMPNNVNRTTHSPNSEAIEILSHPNVIWQLLPYPLIGGRTDRGMYWGWSLDLRTIEHFPLILLIFTLCPLSIGVAFQIQDSQIDKPIGTSPLTARSAWKHTSSKALKVLIVPILFLVITELSRYIHFLISFIFPKLTVTYLGTAFTLLQMFVTIYLMVTLSLYNQCIIFENRSILDIFKRSYSLVKGVRLKFLFIYSLTAWIADLVSSVLMGSGLLVMSVFFTELAPIQDALTPLRFLSLFIGGDVAVTLPNQLDILPTVLILIVRGIVFIVIVPLWAIVTTHLYNERIDMTPEVIEAL